MNIENPNKVFIPVSVTFTEEWEIRRFKNILEHAEKHIKEADYVFGESDLLDLINQISEALE